MLIFTSSDNKVGYLLHPMNTQLDQRPGGFWGEVKGVSYVPLSKGLCADVRRILLLGTAMAWRGIIGLQ